MKNNKIYNPEIVETGKIDTLQHIHGRSLSSLRILLTFFLKNNN